MRVHGMVYGAGGHCHLGDWAGSGVLLRPAIDVAIALVPVVNTTNCGQAC